MSGVEDEINISLSRDEAIVLFEFLSRFSESDNLVIEDQAEERVLQDLCCVFEKKIDEPFKDNYQEIVEKAREKVRDKVEQ